MAANPSYHKRYYVQVVILKSETLKSEYYFFVAAENLVLKEIKCWKKKKYKKKRSEKKGRIQQPLEILCSTLKLNLLKQSIFENQIHWVASFIQLSS